VTVGLDNLDRFGMRDIIRTVVRRIEIADSRIQIIFRVPSPDGPPGPQSLTKTASWQHCTGVGGAHACLAQSLPKARQGLGEPQSKGACIPAPRLNSAHA
jgi:site-specific DNA recombinase